ncbi:MAG: alanine racemase [Chloroflexota bacterium]|nr:alanine racemase [Chloroflexota bacterium]
MAEQKILYPSLNTPAALIDLDTLEANISGMSLRAAEAGLKLRPHAKIHENATVAKKQIASGACGVEVGVVEQAEAMAEQGIDDIIIAHPGYYGGPKGEILKKLLTKSGLKLALVVDMLEQAEIISQLAQAAGRKASVLIKIDLGRSTRFGVPPGKPVLDLAVQLRKLPGIEFIGIYAHEMGIKPTPEDIDEVALEAAEIMTENARMLRDKGMEIEHVSVGASSTFSSTCRFCKEGKFPELTEVHPGAFAVGDIRYMKMGGNTREACAVTVLTTVISTSHSDWAVIDAGYKTFGSDSLFEYRDSPDFWWQGRLSYGSVQGRPDLWFGRMSAEIGFLYYMKPGKKLNLGERLEIVPNNATLTINIHDQIYGVRNGVVEEVIPVTGRGRGN